jgi:hypothetical protein
LITALQALAALNVLYVAAHIVFDVIEGTQTAPPLAVALGLTLFSGAPLALAALVRRLSRATIDIKKPLALLTLRSERYEIPLASIDAARPFWLPLPSPGVALVMRSGRRFRYRLLLTDPSKLLEALADALPSARPALNHPAVAFARARAELTRRRPIFWILKFGVIPLVIAIILFRLHQYIVYGGPFGQYRLLGLAAYLKTFAITWAGTAGGLVVYAGIWRLAAEALALPLTLALPSRARAIRRSAEALCQVAYFGIAPAYVALRLLL